jgi:hypothetical protein
VQGNKNTLSPQRRKERRDTVVILLFADPALSGTECLSIAVLSTAMEKNIHLCGLCVLSEAGGEIPLLSRITKWIHQLI